MSVRLVSYTPAGSKYPSYFAAHRFVHLTRERPASWNSAEARSKFGSMTKIDAEGTFVLTTDAAFPPDPKTLIFIHLEGGEVLVATDCMEDLVRRIEGR